MRYIAVLVLAVVGAGLGGCNSAEPPYPAAMMVSDEGLVGEWRTEPDAGKPDGPVVTMTIAARQVPITDGALDVGGLGTDGLARQDGLAREAREARTAYVLTVRVGEQTTPLLGVLFEHGGRRFIGLQVPPARLNEAGLGGWVIPVHRVFVIQRQGDTLWAQSPRFEVGWLPAVEVLDGTGPKKETLGTIMNEKAGARITTSLDRLLEVLGEAAGNAEAWEESKIVMKRVMP